MVVFPNDVRRSPRKICAKTLNIDTGCINHEKYLMLLILFGKIGTERYPSVLLQVAISDRPIIGVG